MSENAVTVKCLCVALFAAAVCGCASIVSKSRYDIRVKASEPDVTVTVYDGRRGRLVATTVAPATLNLKAGRGFFSSASYRFVFSKPGFRNEECTLKAKTDPCFWLNLVCIYSAPLGMLFVDPATGAMWEFDENVPVMGYMRPLSGSASVQRSPATAAAYNIISCEREAGSDFAYRFVLELKGEESLRAFRAVQQEFRAAIKEDYIESVADADARTLFVEFPEYRQDGNRIEGRAVVLTMTPVSMEYNGSTRSGVMAVKFGIGQYREAREWIRQNIETLARDKNIALVTGELPPAAKFYLGRETLRDGNILEIEFRTE